MQLFSSSLLLLCCALFFSSGVSIVNGDLITDTCGKIAAKDPNVELQFCITTLQSDPTSHGAKDLQALGESVINLIKAKATDINSTIKKLNSSTTDPKVQKALQDCEETYTNALDDIGEAYSSFVKSDYGSANIKLSATLDDASTCQDSFKDVGAAFPLVDETKYYSEIVDIGLAITNMFP
ncbi:hypothetical protein Scep_026372 [Stephania cephalantha]|uniref:Pectinesterase inhibitor domain-containing protein n=1 Tax=Stephania cephalantha TaxID=152367 RepID=A0AAP0HN43_9MAGN